MGNDSSTGKKEVRSNPNVVVLTREVFEKNCQKIQSLEREIQNQKTIIFENNVTIDTLMKTHEHFKNENRALKNEKLHLRQSQNENYKDILNATKIESLEREIQNIITQKDISIYTLTKANEKFQSENCVLKNEKFDLTRSKNGISKKCEQLEIYNKILKSEMLKYNHLSDTYMKANDRLLCEISVLENEELHLSRSKDEIKNKYEQLEKYNETLKIEMAEYKSVSDTLRKANLKLLSENSTLKNEKLHLTQSKYEIDEIKNKCEQLAKHNETLKSEQTKYESVPALKRIQCLFVNLQALQQDIKKTETDILIDEQSMDSMVEKITNKKKENDKKDAEVKQKSLNLDQIIQLTEAKQQITQAEKTLETINLNSRSFLDYKQELSSITETVKMCTKECDSMSDNINKIEEQLEDCREKFVVLQNKGDRITRHKQEECEKILTLLDKQYTLLWNLLYLAEPSESPSEKNLSLDNENISEISESEGVLLSTDGKKYYALLLYNLEEGPDDQQKVLDIIRSIRFISTKEIEVQRLGAHAKNKTRPIKVSMPTFSSVSVILSNKWKLRNGDYKHIRIGPFDGKRGKTGGKQVQDEKSATFAYPN